MNKETAIRVRIAPSPTGNLHVGTARAALYNELFAKHKNGSFIIRIEDTDKARSTPEYEQAILDGLRWLGISWSEGPDIGGEYAPYRQSERAGEHAKAVQQLLDAGKAYRCTCPPKEMTGGEVSVHACDCDNKGNTTGVIRLKVTPELISFTDIIRGEIKVHTNSFGGDFVIARDISDPLFHLAVVCDDEAMKISHVIRGEDHLHNTIKHILLQRALGYTQPMYAHLPLLLDEQRKKLSKRSGETNILAFRDMGFLPQAMLNYLALLGWNNGDDREYYTHKELASAFTLDRVQKSGAIFSLGKLSAMNKKYLSELSDADLLAWGLYHYNKKNILVNSETRLLYALKTELGRFASYDIEGIDLCEAMNWHDTGWMPELDTQKIVWKKSTPEATKDILKKLIAVLETIPDDSFTKPFLEENIMNWIDANAMGRGDTLWPMRYSLTGREQSPGPFEIASVIGKEDTLHRLTFAHGIL
ncbi:MAG: glutamate--tRNA ligase family protein [bacterium]|nr:glutamate--tRNA ligase family protein [bacterium]